MKRFDELTPEQQKAAEECQLVRLLEAILEGGIRFDDKKNHNNLQKRIDAACKRAEKMQTPWFAHEYILDTCRDDLESMARPQAEDAIYLEDGESAVDISSLKDSAPTCS